MKRPIDKGTAPGLTVILPASNEAGLIVSCLQAVLASEWTESSSVEVIVIANGCHDDTAAQAQSMSQKFAARGWLLTVLERAEGGKLGALNAGDAAARAGIRVYLDADVTVSPALLAQLFEALDTDVPRYASGQVNITATDTWASRAYARIWRKVPFMAQGVPGCGVFAVNAGGRARWGAFPDIISDDTFVRLSFMPDERIKVPATYDWPIVEGWSNLVKVRRRQNRGVDELQARYPALMSNDDDRPFPMTQKLAMALRDPVGFAVYSGVALAVKRTPDQTAGWDRGR